MKARRLAPLFILALIPCFSVTLRADTVGSISGVVTDQTGAVIPDTTVTALKPLESFSKNLDLVKPDRQRCEIAEVLASRGAHLDLAGAAGLGRLDVVKSFFDEDGSLKRNATEEQRKEGFLFACGYGCNDIVEFLLGKGVDLAAESGDGQTGLHWAAIGGHLNTVKLLLCHNAPLEVKNRYGGTALGQTLWSAAHGGDPGVCIAILEALVVAGAKIPEPHVPVSTRVDAWLVQHGSRADPNWYWSGEKPRRKK
jgi:hypothetical protein